MWARTWYGTRTSLLLGFVIAFFDVTLGTIAGRAVGLRAAVLTAS